MESLGAARVDVDERGSMGRKGGFAIGIVVEIVDDELAGFHFLRHHVGGAAGTHADADAAGRRGGVHVVEGEIPNGSAAGRVDVDGGVVFVVLESQCHGFLGDMEARRREQKHECLALLLLSLSHADTGMDKSLETRVN